jgi:hypothetical protein
MSGQSSLLRGARSLDAATLAAYATLAERYVEQIAFLRLTPDRDVLAFLKHLPPGPGPVLDWGTGAGETAAIFADRSVRVEATDASPEMIRVAEGLGVKVRREPFEALAPKPRRYRGIWATASLNHAPRDLVADLIRLGAGTLLPEGIFHVAMKAGRPGQTEGRDRFGRYFGYWELDELAELMKDAGLSVIYGTEWNGPSLDQASERYAIVLAGLKTPRA